MSMNARAPTDLHSRLNAGNTNGNGNTNAASSSSLSYDEDMPDDEQSHRLSVKSSSSSNSVNSNSNSNSRRMTSSSSSNVNVDTNTMDVITKKKKVKDRPWKKVVKEYDSILTSEEDVNIIGVSNVNSITPTKDSKAGDVHVHDHDVDHNVDHDDDISEDEIEDHLSSRWMNQKSSPNEAKAATVNAVGLAASRLADKLDPDDTIDNGYGNANTNGNDDNFVDNDNAHLPYPSAGTTSNSGTMDLPYPNAGTANGTRGDIYDPATPNKATDHNRVRMEALNLLNLANSNTSGGYIVRGESAKNINGNGNGKGSRNGTINVKDRVQTALQGLGGGLGLEKRKKYEPACNVNLDSMDYDANSYTHTTRTNRTNAHASATANDNDMEDVTMEDMEYGQDPASSSSSSSPNKKRNGTWGSRYSIDRHLMALHGGLSSKQVLSNLDRDHYNHLNMQQDGVGTGVGDNSNTSARNMYKTSPHEYDDRWNVTQGARSNNAPSPRSRIWNTWIATVKDSVSGAMDKLSSVTSNYNRNGNGNGHGHDNGHTTLGSHRQADHSSSPKGIFTGLAVTRFLDKLSPRSKSAAMRNFAETDAASANVNFSATDDYIYDQKLRRKRFFSLLLLVCVALATIFGILAGVSSKRRDGSGVMGAIYDDVGETIKFFVTSDVPHNTADEVKLARNLANLHPRNGDFLIHLGDIGDADVSMCTMNVYKDAAALLKQSPVPVFVLPGDNDWNNCNDPMTALGYWMDELNRFEDNFDKDENTNFPAVRRQMARSENFSFLHKGVLFVAFHLVDGKVQSESEWSLRIAEDVAWMDEVFNAHGVDEYRSIVIMAHSAPTPKIGDFVWPMKDSLMKMNKPVLYLHANDGEGMLEYNPYPDDLPKLSVVRMEKGYKAPPTHVTIESGPHPFKFKFA